ncbi:porin family protein [Parabacteroides sp. 52]|uniref:outer membrane beta-barrel protein n=1 Tax=unclassified Parabacteroides TaxID=2649774 RepID=UPI0013D7FDAD|nr:MULTISPECIES: outer membrane beta-barrel protein [unclassified Parabacteroides]NDV55082.1 porin family protein [Parabacteroides sp. 52]
MKRFVILVMMSVFSLGVFAQKGQSSFGFNVGYGFEWKNATLGVDYRYNITDEFRLGPSITHLVKNDGLSAWVLDMNAHYVVKLSDMFGFYPLAGLSLSYWNASGYYWDLTGKASEISANETYVGANIGLGGEVYATKQITVGLEVKYNIIKDMDQALFAVRVGYNF